MYLIIVTFVLNLYLTTEAMKIAVIIKGTSSYFTFTQCPRINVGELQNHMGRSFQGMGESFFYTSVTDQMWVTSWAYIILQRVYSAQKTAIIWSFVLIIRPDTILVWFSQTLRHHFTHFTFTAIECWKHECSAHLRLVLEFKHLKY